MPIAYKYSIREVLEACQYFFDKTGRRITFEYSLVAGVNDTKEEATKLVHLIKGMNCHVNLIPVNPIKERDFKRSTKVNIASFKGHLEKMVLMQQLEEKWVQTYKVPADSFERVS